MKWQPAGSGIMLHCSIKGSIPFMFDIVAEARLRTLREALQTLRGTTHVHVQRTPVNKGAKHVFAFRVTIRGGDESLQQLLLQFLQNFMHNSEYFRAPAQIVDS